MSALCRDNPATSSCINHIRDPPYAPEDLSARIFYPHRVEEDSVDTIDPVDVQDPDRDTLDIQSVAKVGTSVRIDVAVFIARKTRTYPAIEDGSA